MLESFEEAAGVEGYLAVYATAVGFTKVGDHWSKSLSELAFEASHELLAAAAIKPDTLVVANAFAELTSSQAGLGAIIADALELGGVDSMRVEAAGASGAAALHVATSLIKSGQSRSTLVVGVEKMRDLDPTKLVLAQTLSENAEISQFFGISFASTNALLARMYMKHFSVERDALSAFPVLAHKNSSTAEHAQFRKKFTTEEVSRSEVVADPMRVLDCAPVGDGSAAVLLVDGGALNEQQKRSSVELLASESSTCEGSLFEREDPLKFQATEEAARRALQKAGVSLESIDFFELHDSYSVSTALTIEALGLSKRGRACMDALAGKFELRGKHPISTFGGMKARGYPVGASGVYQLCEAFLQLTEKAGQNQVKNASKGLLHCMSGIDGASYVHILGRAS